MEPKPYRIASIDILRGIVMIIMALDHTRDFFHATAMTANPLDPETSTIPLYFTRWITHFCAPIFVFLSGLSAYLSAGKKTNKEASNFLIKRGLWLIIAEITLVTLGLSFNPIFSMLILQVIWAIGASMVLLGLLSKVSYKLILIIGVMLVAGHNALDYATLPQGGISGNLIALFFTARGFVIPIGHEHFIAIFYAALPWTGIMFIGFSMGVWFKKEVDPKKRKKLLLGTGVVMIIVFIVSRSLQGYGDPGRWRNGANSFLSFLDTSKYPPSLQYTCMTIGPALLFMAFIENVKAGWAKVATIYGRTPFFYYILHFYILHTLLVIFFFASGRGVGEIVTPNSPFLFRPTNFGYSLPIVYVIWLSVVTVLYLPCRWFDHYKQTHQQWWLKYI